MAPTNALTKTRTRNWLMFGRKPNLIAGALLLLLLLVILLSSSNQRYTADMIKH